jgi:uroporphyrinogen decarboxylase
MKNGEYEDEMTPKERFRALREGRALDRVPCNPSLGDHAARVTGIKLSEYHLSAEKMAEAQIAAYRTYGHDTVGVGALLGIVHALRCEVIYPEQSTPYISDHYIKEPADLDRLAPLERRKNRHLSLCFQAAGIILDQIGDEAPVSVGVRGPFSTAANIRGVENFLRDLYHRPEFAHRLLRFTLENIIPVVRETIGLGAVVNISDPVASGSLIGPKQYQEFAMPYAKELISAAIEMGGAPPTLHICGNTKRIWPAMADTGAGVLSIEDKIDLAQVKQAVGDRVIIAGNVRPTNAMYLGKPEDVVADVKQGLRQAYDSPKGYIVQMGCALPVDTPPENVHAFVAAVHKYGQCPLNPELFS